MHLLILSNFFCVHISAVFRLHFRVAFVTMSATMKYFFHLSWTFLDICGSTAQVTQTWAITSVCFSVPRPAYCALWKCWLLSLHQGIDESRSISDSTQSPLLGLLQEFFTEQYRQQVFSSLASYKNLVALYALTNTSQSSLLFCKGSTDVSLGCRVNSTPAATEAAGTTAPVQVTMGVVSCCNLLLLSMIEEGSSLSQ